MLDTIVTLLRGDAVRQEDALRGRHALRLIDAKLHEAEGQQRAAKHTLASTIGRERAERRAHEALAGRIADLSTRATAALRAGRDDLAAEAADAIARMEAEAARRADTLATLEARVLRLRGAVETADRRIADLRQGLVAARAVRREHAVQRRMGTALPGNAMDEAQDLIDRVLGEDDPLERSEILREIDDGLSGASAADRLGAAGFGAPTRTSGADVLRRLRLAASDD